ncbi:MULTISPECIES: cupin domain-containing protein [unclassified Streptomyces]|uniref:cupin domain-containing protein n=1 Tax=unclassified Streptomyces TaxID=2593676 RepID=UPI000A796C14|nr:MULTISPECIES: cupin domain-containing protein [unclassified Streptomyces]
MTDLTIAECLGEDFLAQALHREHRHVPGALDVAGLMTWHDLNQILAAHRMEPPRMRLSRNGETLLVGGYTTPVATRRHTVWHRLHPAELHARLTEGASLALDSVDELHPPIARLCEAIERELRTRVQANLYAAWSATEGFGIHWDDHDTVIVQLDGAKRWRIYGTTRPYPLYRDIEDPGEAPTEPVADLVLRPGDVHYVPRGVWHAVSADQGTRSLHVTCGLQTRTATDLMAWVSEQLLTHEDWRRDLPLLAAPDVQADAMDGMRKRLAELLDNPGLLARYRAAMVGQAVGRMVPSLPYIDTVPVDGALRVRLTTARAVLDVGEDTVTLSAAGTVYEFAPEVEAVLRPLTDGRTVDLATLADAAGLALEDVAALVRELVEARAGGGRERAPAVDRARPPDSWWNDLAGTLEKVAAVDTGRVAVRQQYIERAIPEVLGIPAPTVTCWTTAHGDVRWASLTERLRIRCDDCKRRAITAERRAEQAGHEDQEHDQAVPEQKAGAPGSLASAADVRAVTAAGQDRPARPRWLLPGPR